ncbi:tRNA (adenosine(37)-N6)-dimethylallyltransferase MiaA [Collinsella sp. An2]|uniref:tRNA (adenosine(37)-N6)-dimethylallyltransferase MiaA n=1 Tax=Collinsella sp. An2 TaxID=1965585 RepID=UPI000B3733F0|nr:tRNA (adenosine(37)-N6)-dimethylallyltransferase MiaA [Collinsella sp. An2]OUP07806.1 tRNA (adenosine(37)-N6)-dimethylallyltransferase MiaA [Collinsella sp. An2]
MTQAIAIVGPTAVGKSDVADRLAERLGTSVISADAMQIYRHMDIGTGKMRPEECHAPLLLIDMVDPDISYSAALYQRDARAAIGALCHEGKVPVICGGTGLYVRAALDDMTFPRGEVGDDRRARYTEYLEQHGADGLYALLSERDPESAACIHPHNVKRVIRALEMCDEGVSYARQQERFSHVPAWIETSYFGLTRDRANLYRRIERRVDGMMQAGLLDEVKRLKEAGYADAITSRQAIGYKELFDYLDGSCTLEEAVELIKMRSRRYAKRQLSWFRRDMRIAWLDMDELDVDGAVDAILSSVGDR